MSWDSLRNYMQHYRGKTVNILAYCNFLDEVMINYKDTLAKYILLAFGCHPTQPHGITFVDILIETI